MPLIEMKKVSKEYLLGETRTLALNQVDLQIEKGEFVAIWGPSGSGKSTLCNLIGMIDTPTSGDVLIDQRLVHTLSDDRRSEFRNRVIGFVFQTFNLIPVLSAVENVMLPLQIQGRNSSKAKKTAIKHLTELGLGDHIKHRPQKLSGGQQQRVAIARALITEPVIVLADEPTANLDSGTADKIIDIMRTLNERSGATFIFATHDQRLLDRVGRRILLKDGVIEEDIKNNL